MAFHHCITQLLFNVLAKSLTWIIFDAAWNIFHYLNVFFTILGFNKKLKASRFECFFEQLYKKLQKAFKKSVITHFGDYQLDDIEVFLQKVKTTKV